ncbi:MAG: AsnC family transcriptional regulator [Deltaproteobacteria bacterium]|nr:AsnC family transcriptional regulator [Deltaproteobacteria bacterium]
MDQQDRDILNVIQSNFPLEARPFRAVAQAVGLTEAQVMERIKALKDKGVIRRIGGNVWANKVGYVSTLCAANVPEDKLERFAETVNSISGVTHNYRRDNELNVWFTLIAPSQEELTAVLESIETKTGVKVLNLPAIKTFKIKVDFEV